jgi:membrane-associated phospholipid phosphatase
MSGQAVKRILIPVSVLLLAMIGLGLLVTKVLAHTWPFTAEDGVNRGLVAAHNGTFDTLSAAASLAGSTPCVIAVTAIVALILRLTLHRWRESLFLCAAVSAQAVVFYFTALAIDRRRPAVRHLDESPPTSSFPSGHTSAAVALYCGLALVLALLVRRTWVKWLCWALVLVPVAVGLARLYRGMHHPSDVIASFLNGVTCLVIMTNGILHAESPKWRRSREFV